MFLIILATIAFIVCAFSGADLLTLTTLMSILLLLIMNLSKANEIEHLKDELQMKIKNE